MILKQPTWSAPYIGRHALPLLTLKLRYVACTRAESRQVK